MLKTNPVRSIARMLSAFVRMPMLEKLLLCLAWLLLAVAAIFLVIVPFRKIAPVLGQPLGAIGWVPLTDLDEKERALLVRRAIARAAMIAPFRHDCLPQAIAGTVLCRFSRVPVTMHLGVKLQAGEDMSAHAWLCSGRVAVTGGYSFNEYVPVGCFAVMRKPI